MKTSHVRLTPLMASIAAFGLTLAPVAFAQTADQTSNTKSLNSVRQRQQPKFHDRRTGPRCQCGGQDEFKGHDQLVGQKS